ncbi:MAG TPA: enoyl-CoA hydratase/isomerase family protein [Candidatus Sulfotelmatobacter sp.]
MSATCFELEETQGVRLLRLISADGTNRLTREVVVALAQAISELATAARPLVIAGNERFFSAGADLREIAGLDAASAYEFSKMGQGLMREIDNFPAPIYAAISSYCMGGGLDLALACRHRIASPHAVFGHRGAALGLITGWGGTQRLPRLIGKPAALQMFVAAEKLSAPYALRIGLIDAIAENPVAETIRRIQAS